VAVLLELVGGAAYVGRWSEGLQGLVRFSRRTVLPVGLGPSVNNLRVLNRLHGFYRDSAHCIA
jgi:hypothetical protein